MGIGGSIGKASAPACTGSPRRRPRTSSTRRCAARSTASACCPVRRARPTSRLAEQHGGVEKAIHEVIENHVRYAGARASPPTSAAWHAAITIPANISGLALLQCRMVAGIAHLRGYDLADPRVHNAVLGCMLGEETVQTLVGRSAAPPMAIATAPTRDPHLDQVMAAEVTSGISPPGWPASGWP